MSPVSDHYDAVILGSGQGGNPLARAMAAAGHRTVIVEKDRVGGTCVNVGCTPTKAMIASGRVARLASQAGEYGVDIEGVRVDLRRVVARKRRIVESFREGARERLERTANLELIFGEARFTGPKSVMVALRDGELRELSGEWLFIDTGARPAFPSFVAEAVGVTVLTSTSLLDLEEIPDHLIILGGGYISVEMGQLYRRFGSRVTIIQRGDQLLQREDEDVADAIAGILREDGIDVLLGTDAVDVQGDGQGGVITAVDGQDGTGEIRGSHLLAATGRVPNTDRLDLDLAGIEIAPRGYVKVDDRLQTNVPGVYALGDVKGGPAFTHVSYDDYRIIETNLLKGGDARVADRLVPYAVFMDPELGRVGTTEREARVGGRSVRVARLPMTKAARAIERGETRGFMKAVVDAESDAILGCAVLSAEGGELMSVLQVAMMGRLPWTALRDGMFTHPTLAESLNNLFMTLD
jgi:pyruvate/2-oxoglutarate dehydrogenase complex dihydrolipoamide dehydrogenase (E3) component